MKIKIWVVLLAAAFLTANAFSQSVRITPKKTIYTRKGKVSFKEKRTFTVVYPLVSGTISPAAKKRLENTISYWRVFETTLTENLSESDWLGEMTFEVKYNKNGILDIALRQDGAGAYPDSQIVNLVIDLKTGAQVKFDEVFRNEKRSVFASLVNQKLAAEKKELLREVDAGGFDNGGNDKEAAAALKEQIQNLEFTAETFGEFSVSDTGVTIHYDAGFPHVIQAAEPDGRYFFGWTEIKPFIKPDGLLAKFAR